MKTEKLNYHLPAELIAQRPVGVRSDSRLLVFQRSNGKVIDSTFSRIGQFLTSGDCLVLNDTKVIPARFFCRRSSGARLKALFLKQLEPGIWEIMLKGARRVKPGEKILIKDKNKADFCTGLVLEKLQQGKYLLKLNIQAEATSILEEIGFAPVPPYIKRGDDFTEASMDNLRYQTVYARNHGAVAAPTAGLHFTDELLKQLKNSGILLAFITLHVGLGTFKPITSENLEEHEMEQEQFTIDTETALSIKTAKSKGGRIIAVGTTSVRTLETAAAQGNLEAHTGQTGLFIRPGYKFKLVDAMVTNFHLPKSTLLSLVAAFAGLENVLAVYRHAIRQQYRFYSYGDAMLIL